MVGDPRVWRKLAVVCINNGIAMGYMVGDPRVWSKLAGTRGILGGWSEDSRGIVRGLSGDTRGMERPPGSTDHLEIVRGWWGESGGVVGVIYGFGSD